MVATYTKWLAKPCILMDPSCSFFLYKITQDFQVRLVAIILMYLATVPLDLNFTYARVQKATARNIHCNAPE